MNTTPAFAQGFTTLNQEITLDNLPVQGSVPSWLSGSLLRNGPAQFAVGGRPFRHWFDGAAMLHRFSFSDGQVSYANKYLQTPAYRGNQEAGTIAFSEFATDPCRSIFQRMMAVFSPQEPGHNANVNITRLADQFLALTETPLPVAFDVDTLDTVGVVDYQDEIGFVGSTAHPHYDPARRQGYNHLIQYGRESYYSFVAIPNEKPLRRQILNETPVAEPAYIHSFGMTENYLILAEFPLVVNPLKLLLTAKPFIENFVWKPEQGTRFLIIDKHSGRVQRTHTADAFFAFHHINAFEDGEDVVLDISAYDDHALVQDLYLDRLQTPGRAAYLSFPTFRRYRLAANQPRAEYETLSPYAIELPRINYRYNGRPYRYAYGASLHPDKRGDFLNALVKVDTDTQHSQLWHEAGCYPGEPVFVADPQGQAEDTGVLLSVVLDSAGGQSFLLVLDAADLREVARAQVPHHVPFGFHGQFFQG